MAGGTAILRRVARVLPPRALKAFGRPVAIHFHGIVTEIDDPEIQSNQLTRDDFYRIAKTLKSEFDVLPIAALDDVLKNPGRNRRAVFLMSDDGYRNSLGEAGDILDALGLPWTLFVSTHHIDTGDWNPYTVARLFYRFAPEARHALPHLGDGVMLADARWRAKALTQALRRMRSLEASQVREIVDAMQTTLPAELLARLKARFASESFLNWPQVAELSRRGVAIGAHAHYHWPMHRSCSPAALAREARTSKARIEHQIGPCRHFAYPVGNVADVSREAWQAVRDAGFAYAFTTLAGSLDGGTNPWLLPRYALQPHDAGLGALAPMLRIANPRLARWQKRLA